VPYPFAHPAAVLPLARLMGPLAVPSALAIGSIVPDLWYFVPLATRDQSHGIPALLWFCLPLGAAAYFLFHLLLKQPLIALLSPRLGAFACAGLPRVPAYAVAASLVAGALTHIAWDSLVHYPQPPWLQHASTALGTALLAGWIWLKLRKAQVPAGTLRLSPAARICIMLGALGVTALVAACTADVSPALDRATLRHLLRTAGIAGLEGFAAALLCYCALWQLRAKRATSA
jgi:hypothetical protein